MSQEIKCIDWKEDVEIWLSYGELIKIEFIKSQGVDTDSICVKSGLRSLENYETYMYVMKLLDSEQIRDEIKHVLNDHTLSEDVQIKLLDYAFKEKELDISDISHKVLDRACRNYLFGHSRRSFKFFNYLLSKGVILKTRNCSILRLSKEFINVSNQRYLIDKIYEQRANKLHSYLMQKLEKLYGKKFRCSTCIVRATCVEHCGKRLVSS